MIHRFVTLEGIFKLNNVERFDLKADPDEMRNLAVDPKKHGELLLVSRSGTENG